MQKSHFVSLVLIARLAIASAAPAQVVPPSGYIYDGLLLGSVTQSCIAVGPGGTFVGIGLGFSANAQAIVLVRESGDHRLVALGFNSLGDCAYDAATDVLYATDNGAELAGAATGDTVFAIPSASTAAALPAVGLELVPAGSVPAAASVALASNGDVLVGDAAGVGAGSVVRIDPAAPALAPFASGLDFTGGIAVDAASGDVFVAESTASFDSQIRRFDSAGAPVGPLPFAGPSFAFGSYDLAFADGGLLASGAFAGDVVSFDALGASIPFIGGLTFASGMSVDAFTGRVEVLSSSFIPNDEDRTVHRFVAVDSLVEGGGAAASDCLSEFYGVALVASAPGAAAKKAICVDGAACDADGVANDRCVFPVGFCVNVADPDLLECDPLDAIVAASIASKPQDRAVDVAAAGLVAALPQSGAACHFSDGFAVPVRITANGTRKPGKGKVKVRVTAADGRRDTDVLSLVCEPAL